MDKICPFGKNREDTLQKMIKNQPEDQKNNIKENSEAFIKVSKN